MAPTWVAGAASPACVRRGYTSAGRAGRTAGLAPMALVRLGGFEVTGLSSQS